MRVLVSGGTGFIGQLLTRKLQERGDEIVLFPRQDQSTGESVLSPQILDGVDGIVNMAGENIANGRWTENKKKRIRDSRVSTTRTLVEACVEAKKEGRSTPHSFVSISAVGFYGTDPSADFTEASPAGTSWLAQVTKDWEAEARRAETVWVRTVILRLGVVLGPGGFLSKMRPPFMMFAGGPAGNGKQWISWIHRDDVVSLILTALDDSSMRGPYNATAPEPVTMKEMSSAIGKALSRPSWLSAPSFALRLLYGEMADELILSGQRVLPERLHQFGYAYAHPELYRAVADAYRE